MVAVFAHVMFAEGRLTPRRVFGLLVGFVGMAILIGPAAFPDSGVSAAGALPMVATAASYAIVNICAGTVKNADPARLALGQQLCSAIPATMLAVLVIGPAAFGTAPDHLGPLVALGVFATAIPILLIMRLIRGADPTRAAMASYLVPVWATVLAIVFLGERVSVRGVVGTVAVLSGVAIVSSTGRMAR